MESFLPKSSSVAYFSEGKLSIQVSSLETRSVIRNRISVISPPQFGFLGETIVVEISVEARF